MIGTALRQALQNLLQFPEKLWLFCDFIHSKVHHTQGFDLFLKHRSQ
jgi:hypothetical protein